MLTNEMNSYGLLFIGLMLVGPTGSGKTKSYESLQIAMTHMKGKINPAGSPFRPVHTSVLNPKSITMGQLYGAFDDLTHEWYMMMLHVIDAIIKRNVAVSFLGQMAFFRH
jgi:energy-coupling factor transporter ATP-binding protein EcfA2